MLLCIQAINIQQGQRIKPQGGKIEIICQITLSCGCPTCAGGRFNPDNFNVKAALFKKGQEISCINLSFSGNASEFTGKIPVKGTGKFLIEIEAHDGESGAAGRLHIPIEIIN